MPRKSRFASQPKWLLLMECLLFAVLVSYIDFITGWEFSLFIVYGVPICVASWYVGRMWGLAMGVLGGVLWFLANMAENPYQTTQGYVWAALNRAVYFAFVGIGTAAMKEQREETLARLAAVTRARELEQEIVRAGEREQVRIGQDLHDGICQNLAAIDCAAQCLRDELEQAHSPQADAAAQVQSFVRETLVEARNLARAILPVRLESEGLTYALEELVARAGVGRACEMSFMGDHEAEPQSSETSLHIYRIAQEAISNAVRHGHAEHVDVTLLREGDDCCLTVRDDGRGFSNDAGFEMGIGLRAMLNRAQLVGGGLEIRSSPSAGTTITCRIPLMESALPEEEALVEK